MPERKSDDKPAARESRDAAEVPPTAPPAIEDRTPEPAADPPPGEATTPEDDLREEHLRRKGLLADVAGDDTRSGLEKVSAAVREANYPVNIIQEDLDAALASDDLNADEKMEARNMVERNDIRVRGR